MRGESRDNRQGRKRGGVGTVNTHFSSLPRFVREQINADWNNLLLINRAFFTQSPGPSTDINAKRLLKLVQTRYIDRNHTTPMTLLYYDPIFLEHQTGNHPEHPRRLEAIWRALEASGLTAKCFRPKWNPATPEQLALAHESTYVKQIREYASHGGGWIEPDTFICPRSYEVALWAVGAACHAVDSVINGKSKTAFCAVRPPGHHALESNVMGFCLFNNIALAARTATHVYELDSVLIVDWDVHHGNGTQAIFWEDPRVGFFSIHRWPFYPGTGAAMETGAGEGAGTTRNLPIEYGTTREDYLRTFEAELVDFAEKLQPKLILISAGFDAHRADPIGSLGLETSDFGRMTEIVIGIAKRHAEGRIVSLLEGGYDPAALADSVVCHIESLETNV